MNKLVACGLLSLVFMSVGCAKDDNGISPQSDNELQNLPLVGSYQSTQCFQNKAASEGFGQAIYTNATITFNDDLTGRMEYSLYSDSGCAQLLDSGTQATNYEMTKVIGETIIVKIHQYDPSDPNNQSTYFLALKVVQDGAYIHIDGARTDSVGPYDAEPSEAELAAFIANPDTVGILFNGN